MPLEKKLDDLSIIEQIQHHEKQAGHHLEAARRVKTGQPKRRDERSASRGRSVQSHKTTESRKPYKKKGKPKKKAGKGIPHIGDHSLHNFAMIPPPCLNTYIMTGLAGSYAKFYNIKDEHKLLETYSYEAFCEGESRTPHSFYTSRKIEKDGKISYDTYVAYVNNPVALVTDTMILKSTLPNLWKNANEIYGYIYYSCVTSYKQDDTHKEGFITFMFPFRSDLEITSDDSNFVIGIKAEKYEPKLPDNQMPKTLATFIAYFGNHIIATNVPMKGSTITLEESEIEKIVKNCMEIYRSPTRLMRSARSFQVQPGISTTVHKKMTFKATKETKALTVNLQMNVPYKSPRISAATAIIQTIMEKCIYQVERRGFVKAMNFQDGFKNTTDTLLRRLWVACVFIISTEICRSELTPERISSLTDSLFKDFEDVFFYFNAYPLKASWEQVKEKHGIVLSGTAGAQALSGFAAAKNSTYETAEAPAVATGATGGMDIDPKTTSRLWDASIPTPIETW